MRERQEKQQTRRAKNRGDHLGTHTSKQVKLPQMGSATPHLTNERITVSFSRREVSRHAVPTYFVKSTRRSPAIIFPTINSSGFVGKCTVASLSTLFLNSALNVTSSG